MWEMLQRLQIDVHHEGVGPDGAVSWLYAVKYVLFFTFLCCYVAAIVASAAYH